MKKSSINIDKSKHEVSNFVKSWLNLNRWVVILYLMIIAAAAVIYVGNVNDTTLLLTEIRSYERGIDDLENEKKMAQSKLKRLQSPDRIIKIATEKLNMQLSEEAPIILEVNEKKD